MQEGEERSLSVQILLLYQIIVGEDMCIVFGIAYNSPTIGLFFFAEDYIMFLRELEGFLNIELEFISRKESKHSEVLMNKEYEGVPIGKLCYKGNTVEIVFLH